MKTNCVGERDGNAHPVVAVFLIVWCFIPIGHEQQRLNKGYAIDFVIKVVQELARELVYGFAENDILCSP